MKISSMLCLTVCCLICSYTYVLAGPNIYFGPPKGDEPMLEDRLVEYIEGAEYTLDCCFFDLKSGRLAQAFIDAKKRGVDVRFVTDDERYFFVFKRKVDETRLRDTIQGLVDVGIPVVHDGRSPLMHNKFCIKDGRFVWTGSYNLTKNGTHYNFNNSLWIESRELADVFTVEFLEMFIDKEFGPHSPSQLGSQEVVTDGVRYEVLFAPEDRPNDRVLELVKNATHEVYFMHYAFTHAAIGDICVEKHFDGLKVEGLFDHLLYRSTGPKAQLNKLANAGIKVSVIRPHKGIQHNKVFIIDPNTDHGVVITGSLNISDSGGDKNDENTIVIHDSATAMLYYNEYLYRTNEFSDDVVAEVVLPEAAMAKGVVPTMEIHIISNGVAVDSVSIEFASRWKIKDDVVAACRIFKGAEEITAEARPRYKSNRLVFNHIGLRKDGDLRSLRIILNDIPTPKRAGLYTIYVKAGTGEGHLDLQPIREQPVIEIFEADSGEEIQDRLRAFDYFLDSLAALEEESDTELSQRMVLKRYHAEFAGLESVLLAGLSEGKYDRIMKLCVYAENAQNKHSDSLIFKSVLHKLLLIRKVVVSNAIHRQDQDLMAMAQLMHELIAKNLEGVRPLAPSGTGN